MVKPRLNLVGEDGNIFNLLALAKKKFGEMARKEPDAGWDQTWLEFLDKIENSESYDAALQIFMEYFDVF
jgi:hypothetical protein